MNQISISVILPTYREKDSIREIAIGFQSNPHVKEVLVIDNNSEAGTVERIKDLDVSVVTEKRQGYGAAIRRGILESKNEYILICEPDGTFDPTDLSKFLAYIDECDLVIGTRTVTTFVWSGANMGLFLRWGNWFVAKLTEVLFNTEYLSDVGCTYRLAKREKLIKALDKCRSYDSKFGFELMLESIILKQRIIQIPVKYLPRVGSSSVTGSKLSAFALGMQMIGLLIKRRIQTIVN
jgi:dolichol-phosphate mannosyltransferase